MYDIFTNVLMSMVTVTLLKYHNVHDIQPTYKGNSITEGETNL